MGKDDNETRCLECGRTASQPCALDCSIALSLGWERGPVAGSMAETENEEEP